MKYDRKIILENGQEYLGYGFGADVQRVCELVFNTSMVGYQEIVSDPSYTYQAIVMSYPLIGNYGMADDDYEADFLSAGALIVREYNNLPSNFRSTASLSDKLKKYNIPGIQGIDTRKLVRTIRDNGSCKVLIGDAELEKEEGLKILKNTDIPKDAVSSVSCSHIWKSNVLTESTDILRAGAKRKNVVAIDCGMKKNIVQSLNSLGVNVTIVPWNTTPKEIEELHPDGVFISNGPGDPQDVTPTVETVRRLIGKYPIFGICLGHQIISLAYGAKTYKLKFGHRGGNHPVKNLLTGKIEITSQNHSYAVDPESIKNTSLELTHINILDNTVEGVRCEKDGVFSVQYHPESAPGPRDGRYLFDDFLKMI